MHSAPESSQPWVGVVRLLPHSACEDDSRECYYVGEPAEEHDRSEHRDGRAVSESRSLQLPSIMWLDTTRRIRAVSNSARPQHERYDRRLTSAIPPAAINATAPTSRATFRLLARCIDATNREADTLRHALLTKWSEGAGTHELVHRLQSLDRSDPDGAQGVDARLTVWFSFADPGDGRLVTEDDPVLTGLSDELRKRLAGTARSVQD
jgi:hypothetical protein